METKMSGMNEHIHFDCYPDLKEDVKNTAKKMGLDVSAYCRLVLSQIIDSKKLKEIIDTLYYVCEKLKKDVDKNFE